MMTRSKVNSLFRVKACGFRVNARGFTLLEVMVALVITAIGLLGIAKIHALAYSSTATAGTRSMVALQAAGLAANMHGNRTYWSANLPQIKITGTTISDATLNAAAAAVGYCQAGLGSAPCDPNTMAAYDLHTYATQLNASLGNSNPITTITCSTVVLPVSCTIKVTWNEKAVALNSQGVVNNQAVFAPDYILYVEP
jgi:type IV pilus assembly protein PilV